MIEKAEQIETVRKLIADKAYGHYYGKIVVYMHHGNVITVDTEGEFRDVPGASLTTAAELVEAEELTVPGEYTEVYLRRVHDKAGVKTVVRVHRSRKYKSIGPARAADG